VTGGVMPNWTWNKVDTNAIVLGGTAGLQPNFVCRKTLQSCRPEGQSNFLGTEWDLGLTYSLAPRLVFDWAFGYMQADSAMAHRYVGSQYNAGAGLPVRKDIGVEPIAIATGRVRFSF
jgi:hypothetical protein